MIHNTTERHSHPRIDLKQYQRTRTSNKRRRPSWKWPPFLSQVKSEMGLYLKITIEALSTWVPNAMLVSPNPQFFQIFHPSAVLTCAHCYKIGLYYKISKIRITLFEILSRKWKITSTEHRKDTSTVHSAFSVYYAYMMPWTVDPKKQRREKVWQRRTTILGSPLYPYKMTQTWLPAN